MALSIVINKVSTVFSSIPIGTKVADIAVSGGTAPYTYTLATGNDNFQIVGTEVQTKIVMTISNLASFSVTASDSSTPIETITSNVNAPSIQAAIQSTFNKPNMIYKIVDDIDLGNGVLTLPTGCTLDFQGGSFSNGIIIFSNTKLTGKIKIKNIDFKGSIENKYIYTEWFKNCDKYIKKILSISENKTVIFPKGNLIDIDYSFIIPTNCTLEGNNCIFNILPTTEYIYESTVRISNDDFSFENKSISENITIRNIIFEVTKENSKCRLLSFYNINNLLVEGCIFNVATCIDKTKERYCFDVYGRATNVILRDCVFKNLGESIFGLCVEIRAINGNTSNVIIENCDITHSGGDEAIAIFSNTHQTEFVRVTNTKVRYIKGEHNCNNLITAFSYTGTAPLKDVIFSDMNVYSEALPVSVFSISQNEEKVEDVSLINSKVVVNSVKEKVSFTYAVNGKFKVDGCAFYINDGGPESCVFNNAIVYNSQINLYKGRVFFKNEEIHNSNIKLYNSATLYGYFGAKQLDNCMIHSYRSANSIIANNSIGNVKITNCVFSSDNLNSLNVQGDNGYLHNNSFNKVNLYLLPKTVNFYKNNLFSDCRVTSNFNEEVYSEYTNIVPYRHKLYGEESEKPIAPIIGYNYFDTTKNIPSYWNGQNWVDASGGDAGMYDIVTYRKLYASSSMWKNGTIDGMASVISLIPIESSHRYIVLPVEAGDVFNLRCHGNNYANACYITTDINLKKLSRSDANFIGELTISQKGYLIVQTYNLYLNEDYLEGNIRYLCNFKNIAALLQNVSGSGKVPPILSYENIGTLFFDITQNKLLVWNGIKWIALGESIFKWSEDNKIQISNDGGTTWEDLSPKFADNVHIKGYYSTIAELPSDAADGDIYMVGPAAGTNTYNMYVKTSSGWVDNGSFTSIQAGVVQELGDSTTEVVSQKVVSDNIKDINRLTFLPISTFNGAVEASTTSNFVAVANLKSSFCKIDILQIDGEWNLEITLEDDTIKYVRVDKISTIFYTKDTYNKKITKIRVYKNGNSGGGSINITLSSSLSAIDDYLQSEIVHSENKINNIEKVTSSAIIIKGNYEFTTTDGMYIRLFDSTIDSENILEKGIYSIDTSLISGSISNYLYVDYNSKEYGRIIATQLNTPNNKILFQIAGDAYRVRLCLDSNRVNENGSIQVIFSKASIVDKGNFSSNIVIKNESFLNADIFSKKIKSTSFPEVVNVLQRASSIVSIESPTFDTPYNININNQEEFDNLQTYIVNAIQNSHKNIMIFINKGKYRFNEDHVQLRENYSDVIISIIGVGNVEIIGKGNTYTKDTATKYDENGFICNFTNFDVDLGFVDENWNQIDIYNTSKWFTQLEVSSQNASTKIGDIISMTIDPSFNKMTEEECTNLYIMITRSWEAIIYKVSKIEIINNNPVVYFVYNGGTVDYENNKLGIKAKYKFINMPSNNGHYLYSDLEGLHIPYKYSNISSIEVSTFIKTNNCILKSLVISNISFYGNKAGAPLISLNNSTFNSVFIKNNKFIGIKTKAIYITNCSNISISDNIFSNCYHGGISANPESSNISVTYNKFNNIGLGYNQSNAVLINGKSFYIAYNDISDYVVNGIGAVSLVTNPSSDNALQLCEGIIERNYIWFSKEWSDNYSDYTLNDAGAIYLGAQSKDVTIRYNTIIGMINKHLFVGIYLDYGTHDVGIFGNIILVKPSGYSIFSQTWTSSYSNKRIGVNLRVIQNICSASMVLYGNGAEAIPTSYCEQNIFLYNRDIVPRTFRYLNLGNGDWSIPITSNFNKLIAIQKANRDAIISNFNLPLDIINSIIVGY